MKNWKKCENAKRKGAEEQSRKTQKRFEQRDLDKDKGISSIYIYIYKSRTDAPIYELYGNWLPDPKLA